MRENIQKSIEWIKKQPIKGCITGSCLLDYFEGQDVDVFVYDEKSFTKLIFAMHHDKMFNILEPLEKWKFDQYVNKNQDNTKFGLVTIKFYYNTCIPVNIIFKKKCFNIFAVLSSFDMDIICKGYDIQTKQYLDLGEKTDKIANWNKWNTAFYDPELWQISRILRQLRRCFKYYNRGYDVDNVVKKYIELIDSIQAFTNIFNSENFDETLKIRKANTKIVKKICIRWLENHSITKEELELINLKIKEI